MRIRREAAIIGGGSHAEQGLRWKCRACWPGVGPVEPPRGSSVSSGGLPTITNVPFYPDCQRQENGAILANNPDAAEGSMQRLGCKAQFDTGFSTIVTDVRERRFMVLDEERGLSYAIIFFDHDGTPQTLGSVDGTQRPVAAPFNRPLTFMIGEQVKIVDGEIRQIEAVIVTVPYHMPSGWNGEDFVSMGLVR